MPDEYKIENGRISGTFLGNEGHGIPTCYLYVDFPSGSQAFGGYDLRHYGTQFITEILAAVGAKSWEELKGKYVRGLRSHCKFAAIGHIVEERWYSPEGIAGE